MNIIQIPTFEMLISNWRQLDTYRQYRSGNEKLKLSEIVCAEYSILYQNIILNKADNYDYSKP